MTLTTPSQMTKKINKDEPIGSIDRTVTQIEERLKHSSKNNFPYTIFTEKLNDANAKYVVNMYRNAGWKYAVFNNSLSESVTEFILMSKPSHLIKRYKFPIAMITLSVVLFATYACLQHLLA